MCFFGSGYAAEKSTYLKKSKTDFYIYLRANIKRGSAYSFRAYLRRNTCCHCAVVKNYYFVADTKIAVAARVYGNFLIGFTVTDKKLLVSNFQNCCTHSRHSYHLLIFGLYEYIMLQSVFSEYQKEMYAKQTSSSADFFYKMPNCEFNTNAVIYAG